MGNSKKKNIIKEAYIDNIKNDMKIKLNQN